MDELAASLSESRAEIGEIRKALSELTDRTAAEHQRTIHALRIVRDDDARARANLWALRRRRDYELAFEEDEPLVTVVLPTYNNRQQLRERALPSVVAQTYERFECIVVGDAEPPETADAVHSFGDERLRFVNLPYRGPYPENERDTWLVTATTPYNTGWELAAGRWLGAIDDDDALYPHCIESLLKLARTRRAEVSFGQIKLHRPDGNTTLHGTFPPQLGTWNMQCSLFHAGLRFMTLEATDWLFETPSDSSLMERMLRIGVRMAMLEEPVVDYYPSGMWREKPERLL